MFSLNRIGRRNGRTAVPIEKGRVHNERDPFSASSSMGSVMTANRQLGVSVGVVYGHV